MFSHKKSAVKSGDDYCKEKKEDDDMKPETLKTIKLALESDNTVERTLKSRILAACVGTSAPKDLVTSKQARDILGISQPTLLSYSRQGLLTQIRFSCRRIRYDKREVLYLAEHGANNNANPA